MSRVVAILFLVLTVCAMVSAQTPSAPPTGSMPNFNFEAPRALSGDWWRDPEIANELRLTEAQKKQLEQVSLNMKLSLISAAANAASAFVKAESALNADQLDEATYDQQVNMGADTASKLIKDLAGTMVSMRKVLTPEQWRKLNTLRASSTSQSGRPPRRWEQQGNQRP